MDWDTCVLQRLHDHLGYRSSNRVFLGDCGPCILFVLGAINLVKAFYLEDDAEETSELV